AAAVAALLLAEQSPGTLMLLAPSDHVIDDVPGFVTAVRAGARAAAEGHLVTFGITPNRPETGYGYIRRAREIAGAAGVFAVAAFVEKPNRDKAEGFLASGDYFWNSGMFLFSPKTYLAELETYAPNLLTQARKALNEGRRDLDFLRLD